MSKGDNRLKILYVLDELKSNSKIKLEEDDDRFLSATDLIRLLEEKHGLTADRKSIYNYITSLQDYGYEIENSRRGYYLRLDEDLELAELKILTDALFSSRFISADKTRKIIKKLQKLSITGSDSLLDRQVYLEETVKSNNSHIIYSIDNIHKAISDKKKISFHYQKTCVDYDSPEKLREYNRLSEDGEVKQYVQSPFALIWKNEFYYLICFDSETGKERTFRVDRMKDVTILDERREGGDYFRNTHFEKYADTAFGMFGGEDINIILKVKNELASVIADRFGKKITVQHDDDPEYFRCSVIVQKSDQFFAWLSGFGTKLRLVFPKDLRDEYRDYLKELSASYETDG